MKYVLGLLAVLNTLNQFIGVESFDSSWTNVIVCSALGLLFHEKG